MTGQPQTCWRVAFTGGFLCLLFSFTTVSVQGEPVEDPEYPGRFEDKNLVNVLSGTDATFHYTTYPFSSIWMVLFGIMRDGIPFHLARCIQNDTVLSCNRTAGSVTFIPGPYNVPDIVLSDVNQTDAGIYRTKVFKEEILINPDQITIYTTVNVIEAEVLNVTIGMTNPEKEVSIRIDESPYKHPESITVYLGQEYTWHIMPGSDSPDANTTLTQWFGTSSQLFVCPDARICSHNVTFSDMDPGDGKVSVHIDFNTQNVPTMTAEFTLAIQEQPISILTILLPLIITVVVVSALAVLVWTGIKYLIKVIGYSYALVPNDLRSVQDYGLAMVTVKYRGRGDAYSGDDDFRPWGLALCPVTGHVLVTDMENDKIHLLTAALEQVRVFGDSGRGPGQYRGPRGICVNSRGDVYIADTGNDRVQVTDQTGHVKFEISKTTGTETSFKEPYGLAMLEDQVFLCDQGHRRVVVISEEGEFVRKFTLPRLSEGNLPKPWNIAVTEGCVAVAVMEGDLYLLTPEGSILRAIIRKAGPALDPSYHRGDFGQALVPCFDTHKHLILTSRHPDSVHVIAGLGQGRTLCRVTEGLAYPGSVVVLPDHCILVCNGNPSSLVKFSTKK